LEYATAFTYSVTSPNICVNHDHDRDRYFDIVDLDDDNDGLCDVIEAGGSTHPNIDANNNRIPDWIENNPSGIIDPSVDNDADGIPNYRDADIAGFVDRNSDGINDNFDRDLDGKPDIFDLDSDNDGLKDYAEAGGTNDPNNNGIVGNDATVAGGANGSLLSSVTDVDRDGIIDLVDPIVFGGTIGTPLGAYTALSGLQVIINSDGDGLINARDMDSDNDGIRDVFELQATATASGGIIPNTVPIPYTNTDADADGLSDAWDTYFNLMNETPPFTAYGSAMGGTNINTPVNTDGLDAPDYLDLDSDNDVAAVPAGGPDWVEGFDDNENGFALEDLRTRAQTYEANNSFPGHYSNTDANSNGLPDWLDDAGGRPAFLTGGNAFFRDANGNGLADLFDEQTGGNGAYYAATATGQPDINNNGAPNYRDNTDLTTLRCSGIDLALAVSLSANNFCVPTTTNVLVANSEVGMTYQLQNDITGANIGAAQAGTGSTLTFPSGLVSATTTFRLQVTAAGGCVDQLNQKATVNINAAPSPASLGLTGNNPVLCNGAGTANLQINGTLPAGFSYRWYTTATGGTPIAGVTGNTYSVNLTGNTSFFVSVVNASGCESARLEVPVTVVTTNPIRLTASGNISDGVTPITLTGSGGVSYTWAPNDGSISGTGSVVTVRPTQTTLYTLTGTTAQGCIFTDTVTIRIALSGEEEIFIPSLFSPNGDNDNDFFLVYGRGIESIDLRVFDRAGNLVYRQTDVGKAINTGWDGKSNAQEQPIGMYVWSLSGKFNSGKPLKYLGKDTGKINLIR
jgi:gliding motility-associated-like protein